MDTTTAAHQAGVTTATIRTWCRMGAVRATKTARRWTINAASLARRIALGIRHTARKALTVQHLTRADYETAIRAAGAKTYSDNLLHADLDNDTLTDGDAVETLHYRRALAVVAEKNAGTWAPNPDPNRPVAVGCHYCGQPLTNGKCDECGPQDVDRWL
jgi:hypothetical protein